MPEGLLQRADNAIAEARRLQAKADIVRRNALVTARRTEQLIRSCREVWGQVGATVQNSRRHIVPGMARTGRCQGT
jgi:hypothetical protein